MEQYELIELNIARNGTEEKLEFTSAKLVIVTEMGSRLWYIDADGITQHQLLADFSVSEDIGVMLRGITAGGKSFGDTAFSMQIRSTKPQPSAETEKLAGSSSNLSAAYSLLRTLEKVY